MKNNNLTLLDPNQIAVQQHDPEHDAQRVVVVGSDNKEIVYAIKESIKDSLKDIKIELPKVEHISPKVEYSPIQTITVPTIVKEIEVKVIEIEKPITVTEVKVIEIEKTIVVKEKELIIERIEVPVIVKETQNFPKSLLWIFGIQTLISLLTLILKH